MAGDVNGLSSAARVAARAAQTTPPEAPPEQAPKGARLPFAVTLSAPFVGIGLGVGAVLAFGTIGAASFALIMGGTLAGAAVTWSQMRG